jgi:tape measure domain-containing protein
MASNDVIVRLRMLGASAFTASAKGAASAVRGIGNAADSTGKKGGKLSGALDRAGGALGGVWTIAGRAGVALGAAGGAAVGMGLKFNAGMEQSQVAFTNLLGSSSEAQGMLDRLYKIAAKTPFEFPQLTQATQRLLGFGMAADKVVPTMTAVGDAVAAAGGGGEQIDKISTALGQIQAKGKVSTEELMQMAESGVPAMKILADQMGITGAQLSDKLKAGAIDADKGIAALVSGMNKRYGGMAAAQSKTFSGMLSTLKDTGAQVLGAVTMPLFKYLRDKLLPEINKVADAVSKWARAGGVTTAITALTQGFKGQDRGMLTGLPGILAKIGTIAGQGFRIASDAVGQFIGALKPMMPFIQNIVLPLLKGIAIGVLGSVVGAFKVLIPIIRIVATVLGWIGTKARPLRGVFEKIGMVIGFVFGPAILRAIGMLGKLGGVFRVIAFAAKVLAVPLRVLGAVFKGLISVVGKLFGVLGKMGPIASRAMSALTRPFRSLGAKFLEFGKAIVTGIANGIKSAPGAILGALKSMLPGGKAGSLIRKAIPGLASGGVVGRGGVALVGEAGPELVRMDAGARVYPLPSPSVSPIAAGGGYGSGDIHVPVYLDGRVITEVVAQRTSDRRARR